MLTAGTISGLQLTSSNCKQAIKLLTDRFAGKQFIVSSYICLIKLTIRGLQSVGITPENFVALLFMSKLYTELRMGINKRLPGSETSETSEAE